MYYFYIYLSISMFKINMFVKINIENVIPIENETVIFWKMIGTKNQKT